MEQHSLVLVGKLRKCMKQQSSGRYNMWRCVLGSNSRYNVELFHNVILSITHGIKTLTFDNKIVTESDKQTGQPYK